MPDTYCQWRNMSKKLFDYGGYCDEISLRLKVVTANR
jgi:hypothetical protein